MRCGLYPDSEAACARRLGGSQERLDHLMRDRLRRAQPGRKTPAPAKAGGMLGDNPKRDGYSKKNHRAFARGLPSDASSRSHVSALHAVHSKT
jgi:hypothetical protein